VPAESTVLTTAPGADLCVALAGPTPVSLQGSIVVIQGP
jgi:hypothetical protein